MPDNLYLVDVTIGIRAKDADAAEKLVLGMAWGACSKYNEFGALIDYVGNTELCPEPEDEE